MKGDSIMTETTTRKLKGISEDKRDPKAAYLNRKSTRFIYFKGVTLHIQAWADALGINRNTLSSRINTMGWSIPDALSRPIQGRKVA